MDNHFNFQIEDPCLRFIREDSSQNASDLFRIQNSESAIKVEEQIQENLISVQPEPKSEAKSGEKGRKKSDNKKKTFYRDKMANLFNEQNFIRPEYNYGQNNQTGRGKAPISRDEQLRRNRESAKNSRQRRKQYIETLEQKNAENQKMIDELKRRLRQAQFERDRLKEDNGSYIKTFLATKNEAFENLHHTLRLSGKKCDEQISEALKVMKAKYGAAGSERISTTDYYIKEVIEMLVADIHKYLMECVRQDSGLFGLGQWNRLDDQIASALGVKKEVRIHLSRNYGDEMHREFDRFKELTNRFYEAYQTVQGQARVIQKIFDKISLQFNDEHIARLLLWLQQNKFLKQLKKMRSQWTHSIEFPEQATDKVRKMSKNI